MLNNITDRIHDINIVDLIKSYGIDLKKAGTTYKACCPFHQEKTPSFTANSNKNIFKCFGCGKGGDAITFVMDHEKLSFWDAVKDIAKKYSIELPEYKNKEEQDKAEQEFKHKQSLYIINSEAAGMFQQANRSKEANDYIKSRVSKELIDKFGIGYAPDDWNYIEHKMHQAAIGDNYLLELGLISESKGKKFDFFRNRMMFPVHDHRGKVVGFSGRVIGKHDKKSKSPKYLNSPESRVFKKSKLLYGLYQAKEAIQKEGFAYRVEGQTDVVSMHQYGYENTVAPLGTALAAEQVKLLNRFTAHVVLFTDGDAAGEKALIKDGELFLDHGFGVTILILPEDEDPDSFIRSGNDLQEYAQEHTQEYIVWRALILLEKVKSVGQKADVMAKICKLLISVDDPTKTELYIDAIIAANKSYGPRKKWNDKIKQLQSENAKQVKKESLPKTVSIKDFEKYGFYEEDNCYQFKTRFGYTEQGSNFILKPLFHLESWENTKRLFEITNEHGISRPIEFLQKDLISLSQFRLQVERLGNFLWMAGEAELTKLKSFLYEKTETAKEITQMGWNKDGFWTWANGIYDGKHFKEINKYGIVKHNDKNYYIAAFAETFATEDKLFNEERKYKYEVKENDVSLYDYTQQFVSVFGDNGMISLCFLIATAFCDLIAGKLEFFPLLNVFGIKGSGKTQMAISLRRFFAKDKGGPNINNTSLPALAEYVGHLRNGILHIDEYKESMGELVKIEFLKGIWDRRGRSKMNIDVTGKRVTSAVDGGVILTGQEKPIGEPALFTRFVYLTVSKAKHSQAEINKYDQLKKIEEKGINHLIHDILKHREHFEQHWYESYQKTSKEFIEFFEKSGEQIQSRILNNWVAILSAYRVLEDKLKLPFSFLNVADIAAEMIREQNSETEKGDELGAFWDTVLALASEGSIREEVDFRINHPTTLKINDTKTYDWEKPMPVLMLNHSRIFKLYRKMGRQGGENVLPIQSLEYYLKTHEAFLGKKTSVAFKKIDPGTGNIMEDIPGDGGKIRKPRHITTAYCFRYDVLNVELGTTFEEEDIFEAVKPDEKVRKLHPESKPKTSDIPY